VSNNEKNTAVREVKEETGLEITPGKILFVEDICSSKYRIVKTWFLCQTVGGQLEKTQNAIDEKILDARWYRRDELDGKTVYPRGITSTDWGEFFKEGWEAKYLDMSYAEFQKDYCMPPGDCRASARNDK